jgi:uncharacterized protein YbjT (DUF2867 family)
VFSTGADAASRNAYLRLKGEVEESLSGMGFARVDLLRPGLLLGERSGERRVLERIAMLMDPLSRRVLRGSWDHYAGIDSGQVATAMAVLAERRESSVFRHHNREIRALAAA